MKPRTLLIAVAAVTFACGGGSHQSETTNVVRPAQADSGSAPGSPAGGGASSTPAESVQTVTLEGCLQEPGLPATTGTSGTQSRARATGPDTAPAGTGGASADRFMLVAAMPARPGSGGVGANGAGGSGGPLVSGRSSFALEGIPDEARAHVNKQVRVTGRLGGSPAESDGSATPARGTTTPGHGSMGSAADAPASGGGRGSMGAATEAAARDISPRRLMVETVQVVAASCVRQ